MSTFNDYDNLFEGYENSINSYVNAHEIVTVDSGNNRKFEFSIIFRNAGYVPCSDVLPDNTGEGFFRKIDLDGAPIAAKPYRGSLKQAIELLHQMSDDIDENHYGYIVFGGKKRPSEMKTLKTDIDKFDFEKRALNVA